jgi:glycopeptide antibiotics resistance protein
MQEEARYNLNLFEVYRAAWNGNTVFMTQLIGNVVMFIPLGILVPICFRRLDGFFVMLLISFACSLAIETTQLYTHTGLFELVDLINNTAGGMIGFLIYKIGYGIWKVAKKSS